MRVRCVEHPRLSWGSATPGWPLGCGFGFAAGAARMPRSALPCQLSTPGSAGRAAEIQ